MPNSLLKKVKIYRAEDDISSIVKEAVESSRLRGKGKIFIKPNLSHPEYLPGVVTSPELMRQLVGLLRMVTTKSCWRIHGFNYPCWTG
jgi:hypothetical protein